MYEYFVLYFFKFIVFSAPSIYDFNDDLSNSPERIVCDGNSYILALQS